MSKFLDVIYAAFVGLFVACFIGFGVAAFYPAPEMPEYPAELERTPAAEEVIDEEEMMEVQAAYEEEIARYDEERATYSRNVAVIVVVASIVTLLGSIMLASKIGVLADGLLLGGFLTLMYGVGRSFITDDPKVIFLFVTIGLLSALVVGYWKFVRGEKVKQD